MRIETCRLNAGSWQCSRSSDCRSINCRKMATCKHLPPVEKNVYYVRMKPFKYRAIGSWGKGNILSLVSQLRRRKGRKRGIEITRGFQEWFCTIDGPTASEDDMTIDVGDLFCSIPPHAQKMRRSFIESRSALAVSWMWALSTLWRKVCIIQFGTHTLVVNSCLMWEVYSLVNQRYFEKGASLADARPLKKKK